MASCRLGEESLAGPLKRTQVTTTRFMEASRRMSHQGRDTLVEEAPAALPLRTGWVPQGPRGGSFASVGKLLFCPLERTGFLRRTNPREATQDSCERGHQNLFSQMPAFQRGREWRTQRGTGKRQQMLGNLQVQGRYGHSKVLRRAGQRGVSVDQDARQPEDPSSIPGTNTGKGEN